MQLNYKASNIANAERKSGQSFFDGLAGLGANMSVSTLMFLLEAGGLTEDESSDMLDNQSIEETVLAVFDAMTESGFLANQLKTPEMEQAKAEMRKAVAAQKKSQKTSENSGESKK